jgi:hypothetical protein
MGVFWYIGAVIVKVKRNNPISDKEVYHGNH